MPVKVFVCYAAEDEKLRVDLIKHAAGIERSGEARFWHDGMLGAGDDVNQVRAANLDQAGIVVLLLSADFLQSNECMEIAEQAIGRGTVVVPVLVRPSSWEREPLLGRFRPLPTDRRPVEAWRSRDEAWVDVIDGLRQVIAKAPPPPSSPPAVLREGRRDAAGPGPAAPPPPPPPIDLTPQQMQALSQALLSAFPTESGLEQMVFFGLGKRLSHIVRGENHADIIFKLIAWAEAHGSTRELIVAARNANPGNPALRAFAAGVGVK